MSRRSRILQQPHSYAYKKFGERQGQLIFGLILFLVKRHVTEAVVIGI